MSLTAQVSTCLPPVGFCNTCMTNAGMPLPFLNETCLEDASQCRPILGHSDTFCYIYEFPRMPAPSDEDLLLDYLKNDAFLNVSSTTSSTVNHDRERPVTFDYSHCFKEEHELMTIKKIMDEALTERKNAPQVTKQRENGEQDEPTTHARRVMTVSLTMGKELLFQDEQCLDGYTFRETAVRYTINGNALQNTCPGQGNTPNKLARIHSEVLSRDACMCVTYLKVTASIMACERVYGLHRVSAILYNNSNSSMYDNSSVELSLREFVVIPAATKSVNNTALYERLLSPENINSTSGEFHPDVVSLVQSNAMLSFHKTSFSQNETRNQPIGWFYIVILMIASMTASLILIISGVFKYCRKVPVYRHKNKSVRSVNDIASDEDYTYDIFLCSSDSQYHNVTTRLLPMLDELGFRVCFDDRDFHPGRRNLEQYSEAVKCSETIVLVPDPDSMNQDDREFWQLKYIDFSLHKKVVVVNVVAGVGISHRLRFEFDAKVVEWRMEGADTEFRQLLIESLA